MITPKIKRRIKREISTIKPTIRIGKDGATTQIIYEVSKQLESREIVKAKILKTALKDEETKNIATKIASQTDSQLIEVRGHTFLLYKQKNKKH